MPLRCAARESSSCYATGVNYPTLKGGACETHAQVDQTKRLGCLNPSFIAEQSGRYVVYRFKTHPGMLLQSQALEVPIADKRQGKHETGRN